MMAGREKFDFVGAFWEAPVTGLNWSSFFDLPPWVKRDICHLLVQERTKGLTKGGTIRTESGEYRVSRILVDARSVVNLMPIHLLCFLGAKLVRKAGGMVIRRQQMH